MPKFKRADEYVDHEADVSVEAPDPVEFARSAPVAAPPDMATALAMIAEALTALKHGGGDSATAQRLDGIERFLLAQEQTRPHENLFNPPLRSALNPLGERDHPRPDFKCRMIWVGYELKKEGQTLEEIELLNRMQPGEYRVTKADGRTIPFRVASKLKDSGALDMLTFHFPCKGSEDRQNHAPMVSYLREALGEQVSVASLLQQVAALKAQLATGGIREPDQPAG